MLEYFFQVYHFHFFTFLFTYWLDFIQPRTKPWIPLHTIICSVLCSKIILAIAFEYLIIIRMSNQVTFNTVLIISSKYITSPLIAHFLHRQPKDFGVGWGYYYGLGLQWHFFLFIPLSICMNKSVTLGVKIIAKDFHLVSQCNVQDGNQKYC